MSLITKYKIFESNEDDFISKVKANEYYQELYSEFNLLPLMSNKNTFTLNDMPRHIAVYVNLDTNKIKVFLGDKSYHNSTFFKLNSDTDTLETGVSDNQIEIMLAMAAMGIMSAVWKFNYDNYLEPKRVFHDMNIDKLTELVKDSGLTVSNVQDTNFKDAQNRYMILKNLLEIEPHHVASLEYLPNSIDEDDETKQVYKDLIKDSPSIFL